MIAVEFQGHGRTGDIERPITSEQLVEDVATLLGQLGIKQADLFGLSMGGVTALRFAIRHPDLVRTLVAVSTAYCNDGFYPSACGIAVREGFRRDGADLKRWTMVVDKMKQLMMDSRGSSPADLQSIKAPTLLLVGDYPDPPGVRGGDVPASLPCCQQRLISPF